MGLFCVNFHVRTADTAGVKAALSRSGSGSHVLAAKGGWTSLYDEQASTQDESRIREITQALSSELRAATIAFLVHDSDIACYWLFDGGELVDQYNSCPDYFGEDADQPLGPAGGQAKVLRKYCRRSVNEDDLAAILAEQPTFAENIIEQLARALGIDPERALSDYRDLEGGEGPSGIGGFGEDDDGDDGDDDGNDDDRGGPGGGGPDVLCFPSELVSQVAGRFAADASSAADDPQAQTLVNAAAAGDLAQIDRLLDEGAAIDGVAPASLPAGQAAAGLAQLFPGGLPRFSMTPLLAAVVHQRVNAAQRLLDRGADPNRSHPLWGTAVHTAAGAGNVELVRLLIDRGGSTSVVNRQGQTPLGVIAASRATVERLGQARSMLKTLGMKMPGVIDKFSTAALPTAGWDACERLLKSRGAR